MLAVTRLALEPYAPRVARDVPVEVIGEPAASLVVPMNELPKRGSWFDVGDGTLVRATEIRTIWGEPLIYAVRGAAPDATSPRPAASASSPPGTRPRMPSRPRSQPGAH
jgi:hypothetical protein